MAFNSTRCIRNCFSGCWRWWFLCDLSTPHGALGTADLAERIDRISKTFNSTRCIRNYLVCIVYNSCFCLSTPHGALGTKLTVSVSCVHPKPCQTFNSTRCIRNKCFHLQGAINCKLSTPHGALGTLHQKFLLYIAKPFNSTRCIRNSMG